MQRGFPVLVVQHRRIEWTTASGDSRAHGFAWKSGNDEKQQNSCSCSARVQYSPDDKEEEELKAIHSAVSWTGATPLHVGFMHTWSKSAPGAPHQSASPPS